MNNNDENNKNIEIVSGDGSNLEISPVYEHLNTGKPKCDNKRPKNIIIPKVTDKKEEENKEEKK